MLNNPVLEGVVWEGAAWGGGVGWLLAAGLARKDSGGVGGGGVVDGEWRGLEERPQRG